jgi:hypothetical protein
MKRQERVELERRVQELERQDPKAAASAIEKELERLSPIAYGNWKEETPVLRSRLRAIQRWRSGARGRDAGRGSRHLFPYVWPIGDRQRKEVDSAHQVSPVVASGSWRLFLYNCGPEVVRDVRIYLDHVDLDYSPSILTGRFAEVHWQRIDSIRAQCLSTDERDHESRHLLRVDFVVNKGLRQAHIEGELVLHSLQGWTAFAGRDGRGREIE